MTDIQVLKEMLVPAIQVDLQQGKGKPSVNLIDKQVETTVEIKGVPHDSIVFKVEAFKDSIKIFVG